ncbi:unnamed protein product [Orchesella dallaii]|uniref:Odorant receptor n=1 Tax=Orchesella dallaii TaxID=48710 RepID=A0ABP1Q114_9HEXA
MEPLQETDYDFMLSQFHMNLVKFFLKVTSTFGFCPMYVDTVRGKLTVSFWSWARATHNWLWMAFYGGLVLPTHAFEVWLYSKNVKSLRSNKTMIYLIIAIIYCWFCTLFLSITTLKPLIFCQYTNGLLKYVETFPAKYITTYNPAKEKKIMKLMEFLMLSTVSLLFFLCSLLMLHGYLFPSAPPYPAYRVPAYALSLPFYLISCTWFATSGLNYIGVTVVVICGSIFHFFSIFPILKNEMRLGQSSYKTIEKLRQPHHLIANYRAIQVLMKIFNVEVGIIFVPIQVFMTSSTVVANVSLVFQWHIFRVIDKIFLTVLMLTGFVCWGCFLWLAGLQYKESKKTVESWHWTNWKKKEDRMYMKRVTPTCQPVTFGDGKRFIINPTKVLQFFRSASKNTFRGLATYAKVFEN